MLIFGSLFHIFNLRQKNKIKMLENAMQAYKENIEDYHEIQKQRKGTDLILVPEFGKTNSYFLQNFRKC